MIQTVPDSALGEQRFSAETLPYRWMPIAGKGEERIAVSAALPLISECVISTQGERTAGFSEKTTLKVESHNGRRTQTAPVSAV